jgi:hypothetical protein
MAREDCSNSHVEENAREPFTTLLCMEGRKIATCAFEALRLFDEFQSCVHAQQSNAPDTLRLATPPAVGKRP